MEVIARELVFVVMDMRECSDFINDGDRAAREQDNTIFLGMSCLEIIDHIGVT